MKFSDEICAMKLLMKLLRNQLMKLKTPDEIAKELADEINNT